MNSDNYFYVGELNWALTGLTKVMVLVSKTSSLKFQSWLEVVSSPLFKIAIEKKIEVPPSI